MKKTMKPFAMRLVSLALIIIATLTSFFSCSSDDDDGASSLVGTWVSPAQKSNDVTEEYYLDSDESGVYKNSSGTWGDFTYTVTGGPTSGNIHVKINYVKAEYSSTWRDEFSSTFTIEGNTLNFRGRKYTRK